MRGFLLRRFMTDPIQPWPVVRRGANGHPVRTLQHLLRAHGQQVSVDGAFGPLTEAAVKAVQTASGLTADGVVGPQTWPRLIVQVRQGDSGEAVRGVQEEFQFRNLSGDPSQGVQIDGIFGQRRRGGARLPAGARLERGRDRRAAHLAGARQRHAGRLRRPSRNPREDQLPAMTSNSPASTRSRRPVRQSRTESRTSGDGSVR